MRLHHFLVLFSLLLAGLAGPAAAAPVRTDNIEVELISRTQTLAPGEPAVIGLRMKHDPHWHTYWQNPGDSGMPTTIQWKLPGGTKVGPILWPVPKRIPIAPLMNHGYEGEIVLPVEIRLPADWPPGQDAKLAARADWLICKDVCIPGGADVALTVPVAAASAVPDPRWKGLFDAAFAAMPAGKVTGSATTADAKIELRLNGVKPVAGREVFVLSSIEGLVESAAPQGVRVDGNDSVVTLAVTSQLAYNEPRMTGVAVGFGDKPLAFEAPLSGKLTAGKGITAAPKAAAGTTGADTLSLGLALVFALAGGLILNLMPCVFPVLSLKVLGFARGGDDEGARRTHALVFAFGVVGSFMLLALGLLALKSAGEAVGWGFQLQSPWVVTLLALLFFVLGLNLSGVFEFDMLLPGAAGVTLKHPAADALFSGVLAAVVAAPCTAPFMGAALGFAITQSGLTALSVFAALGVGMALPYVLLAWFPGWLKKLPRPGPWLATFKQLLAFPMYATVVWLTWVLVMQTGADAVPWLGAGMVLLALAAWLAGRSRGATLRLAALVLAACGVVLAWPGTDAAAPAAQTGKAGGEWTPFVRADIDSLNAAGTPVFVDFTAAWCVTCQVNKKVVLDTREVREAFKAKSVLLMRADWTRRDPAITQALAEFGRNGVPVYVLYAPGKPPQLLPEILTTRIVTDALAPL